MICQTRSMWRSGELEADVRFPCNTTNRSMAHPEMALRVPYQTLLIESGERIGHRSML